MHTIAGGAPSGRYIDDHSLYTVVTAVDGHQAAMRRAIAACKYTMCEHPKVKRLFGISDELLSENVHHANCESKPNCSIV